jgi:RNA polymerase sigma factor (sigma-70 family)
MTDDELIQRAKEGCHEAFTELYEKYYSRVRHTVYSILREADYLDDIVQEIFAKIYVDLPLFRGNSLFSTWITSIAHAKTYDFLRVTRQRKDEYLSELYLMYPSADDQEQDFSGEQERQLLGVLIAELPEHLSVVAKMRIQNKTCAQIAKKLNVTENAVEKRNVQLQELLPKKWKQYQTDHERNSDQ